MDNANVKNIRSILSKIWSGELDHNQKLYFGRTSACLAGWDFRLNSGMVDQEENIREWVTNFNNLSYGESFLLYNSYSTRYLHRIVIEALEAGRRLEIEDVLNISNFIDHSYENGVISIIVHSEDDYDSLIEFFGGATDITIIYKED